MQFKHPEFLWALLFLLIPVIVHFFQLRRFKTEYFPNVSFLQQIIKHSRKSSQLKKWLVLSARLLALAALILAFARPYIPKAEKEFSPDEMLIYIDNSLSMQQRGEGGELLKQGLQSLVQNLPGDKEVTILTNDRAFEKGVFDEIKREVLQIDYSPSDDRFKTIMLRAQNILSKRSQRRKQLVAISDFQKKNFENEFEIDSTIHLNFIQLKANSTPNFSIDSLQISKSDMESVNLQVYLSASTEVDRELTVDLFDGMSLFAKSSALFEAGQQAEVQFSIPRDQELLNGKLVIEDHQLQFDNFFYFSLQKSDPVRVVTMSRYPEDQLFLKKLFNSEAFNLEQQLAEEINYNQLENADFIVLNELDKWPAGIDEILKRHLENGGYLALIPPPNGLIEEYNHLMSQLGLRPFIDYNEQELRITTINFSHALYAGVFDGEIDNFEYPKTEGSYRYEGGESVLRYNNGNNFLAKDGRVFVFTAPLNKEKTNFKQSPLIVPTFYNMAIQSSRPPQPAYVIGEPNQVAVRASIGQNEVIHLRKKEEQEVDFIPPQRRYTSRIELDVSRYPDQAGLYEMVVGKEQLGTLAFNYSRAEADLNFMDFERNEGVNLSRNVEHFLKDNEYSNKEDSFWKWFVIFALVFFTVEFILLKFFKV